MIPVPMEDAEVQQEDGMEVQQEVRMGTVILSRSREVVAEVLRISVWKGAHGMWLLLYVLELWWQLVAEVLLGGIQGELEEHCLLLAVLVKPLDILLVQGEREVIILDLHQVPEEGVADIMAEKEGKVMV